MKFTNKKRGFTIVELIIVIAVIAVLAAVLIPVFSGLIQQGKDAEAKVVVNTLNKGLAMSTSTHKTMQSALEAVETNVGINVAKLNETYAKTGNQILWDSKIDSFLFVNGDNRVYAPEVTDPNTAKIDLWAVATTEAELSTEYSNYWYGSNVSTFTVSTGFDAGTSTDITSVTYKNETSQGYDIVIRTNGATVVTVDGYVDSANANVGDVVRHYGDAGNVNIIKCAMASYHEFGAVAGTISIKVGHLEIESTGSVGIVSVVASNANDFAVSNNKGGSLGIVKAESPEVITSENVKVSNKTGVMTSEDADAVAYSEEKGFIKTWEMSLGNGKTTLLVDLEDKVYNLTVKENTTATFDLNGHKFLTDQSYKNGVYGTLTFMDSSADETGLFYSKQDYIRNEQDKTLLKAIGPDALIIIESGVIEGRNGSNTFDDNNGQFGVGVENGGNIIMNGGTIKAGWYAIAGNGSSTGSSSITINGGKLISVCDYAIYLPHAGVTTINGGIIDGAAGAISMNKGTLTINGGSFSSDGTGNVGSWGDGTGANKSNALVNANASYGDVSIVVNGGIFNVKKLSVFAVGTKHAAIIAISSGMYSEYIDKWVVSGYTCVDNGNGTWSIVKK